MNKLTFNTERFRFKELISEKLDCGNLDLIHLNLDFAYNTKFERKNDQSTHYHKEFYDLARSDKFINIYTEFIREIIKPYFDNKAIVYQSIPTFRLHFPNNIAVGEYHRDRQYREKGWLQKVRETNFFMPFTSAYGTNTIWAESKEGLEDFAPMEAEYGEIVAWDGCNLLHGNKTNIETTTRVSVDFRVILHDNYFPSSQGSINTQTQFAIGGYYSLME